MASKIDFTGLNNFRQKLQKYSNFTDYTAKLISAIVDKGVEIAREEYAGVADVKIDYDITPLSGKIIANDKNGQIAYLEFGTGEYAKGTYEGTLPMTGVPLTGSWTYYYSSPYKRTAKVDRNNKDAGNSQQSSKYYGKKGWFTTKLTGESDNDGDGSPSPLKIGSLNYRGKARFTIGQKAGNQMYRVSKRLRQALPTIIGSIK